MLFRIMTLSVKGLYVSLSINYNHHNNTLHYARGYYAECLILFIVMLTLFMLCVIVLIAIMLNDIALRVIMLNVTLLSVFMTNVIMLSVLAAFLNLPFEFNKDFIFLGAVLPSAGLSTSEDLKF